MQCNVTWNCLEWIVLESVMEHDDNDGVNDEIVSIKAMNQDERKWQNNNDDE